MKKNWLYIVFLALFLGICLIFPVGTWLSGPSEAGANEVPNDLMFQAIQTAHDYTTTREDRELRLPAAHGLYRPQTRQIGPSRYWSSSPRTQYYLLTS